MIEPPPSLFEILKEPSKSDNLHPFRQHKCALSELYIAIVSYRLVISIISTLIASSDGEIAISVKATTGIAGGVLKAIDSSSCRRDRKLPRFETDYESSEECF